MTNISLSDFKGKFKRSVSPLRKAGFETLEDLLMTDILYLSKLASIPEEMMRKTLLSAELQSYGISSDISDAIADYGGIYRAGELAAFDSEDIQTLLATVAKQGDVLIESLEEFEKMIAEVPRLTLGEYAVKAFAFEKEATPLHHETVEAMNAEDPVITMHEVNTFIKDLEDIFNQYKSRTSLLASKPGEPIEFKNMQILVASLREEIKVASSKVFSKVDPSMEVTQFESEVTPLLDERLEIDEQMKDISDKIVILQDQLSALKTQQIAIHEDLGLTISEEKEPVAARGEN